MKKVLLAVLAISAILIYPSSYLVAGSPATHDVPYVITPHNHDSSLPGSNIGDSSDDGGGEDKGDADDLAGLKRDTKIKGSSSFEPDVPYGARFAVKIWWMYFFIHKVF